MTNLSKIARPYAKAIFSLAEKQNVLGSWSESLQVLGLVAQDPAVMDLMKNPKFSKEKLVNLFLDVGAQYLSESAKNLVQILGKYKRLSCLPDIARLYEIYKARAEQVVKVELLSATELALSYQQLISEKLSKRFHCQIVLQCQTDPSLLGGAIIRAGDYVIDGSVRGRLQKLRESIVL